MISKSTLTQTTKMEVVICGKKSSPHFDGHDGTHDLKVKVLLLQDMKNQFSLLLGHVMLRGSQCGGCMGMRI